MQEKFVLGRLFKLNLFFVFSSRLEPTHFYLDLIMCLALSHFLYILLYLTPFLKGCKLFQHLQKKKLRKAKRKVKARLSEGHMRN